MTILYDPIVDSDSLLWAAGDRKESIVCLQHIQTNSHLYLLLVMPGLSHRQELQHSSF